MKVSLFSFIALYGIMLTLPIHPSKSIERNGMKVSWNFEADVLNLEIVAPTIGWVAVGFNDSKELEGHHLMMAAVEDGEIKLSDRYIQGIGNHKAVEQLGGINHLSRACGKEVSGKTYVQFSVARTPNDSLHQQLQPGKSIFLLLAYSSSDDFEHHSMMRTGIEIIL